MYWGMSVYSALVRVMGRVEISQKILNDVELCANPKSGTFLVLCVSKEMVHFNHFLCLMISKIKFVRLCTFRLNIIEIKSS